MITDEKAFSTFGTNIMDRIRPETICRVSVNPSRNPMFHKVEIEEGVGRSMREFFMIRTIRIMIDITRALTPPNFDGIERKIT